MKKNKKQWLQYIVAGSIVLILYATGLLTDIIGFAQQGILKTGVMNPDTTELAVNQREDSEKNNQTEIDTIKADLGFSLYDVDGKIISLEDLRGKPIFLNFWATWCPPCIAEMPGINKLHNELKEDVNFVMISLDQNFEKAIQFNKKKKFDLPIYQLAGGVPEMFQSSSIPTTYIIDAKGNLALTHHGMADYDNHEFKEFLKMLQ